MRISSIALAATALATPAIIQAAPATPTQALIAEYEAYGRDRMAALPGDGENFALADVTPAAIARHQAALNGFRTRLVTLRAGRLNAQDALNAELLLHAIDEELGIIRFDEARLAFNSDGGFDTDIVYTISRAKLRNTAAVDGWLRYIEAIPAYYQANLANARRGIATHFTQPAVTVDQVLVRARRAAATPLAEDGLLTPIRTATGISDADRASALARATQLITDRIQPERQGFIRFLESEYRPAARPALGASSLPDGTAYYQWLARRYTTLDTTPEAIHATGLREVARIRAAMEAIKTEVGFAGDLKAFIASLRADPRFVAPSREALLDHGREIANRINAQLPQHFNTLPRLPYAVLPVPAEIEEGYTTGRYFGGDIKAGVAGGLMLNTSHLDQRPLYELPALVLHEGVPGHHTQGALGLEIPDAPEFRRQAYYSGFGEGWGLYAEYLGEEMGIYRTPYERFGRLSYDMWRACRLVADTGLHIMHWNIDQARACFLENTALSPLNIEIEVQRYISWPGQALAYKMGELEIRRLRADAERRLGDRFDERRFHDAVLLQGALPLSVLDRQVEAWVQRELARR